MIFVYPHTCFSLNPWNLLSFCHFFVLLYAGYYKYTLHSKRLIVQTIRRKKINMKDFRRTKSESEREDVNLSSLERKRKRWDQTSYRVLANAMRHDSEVTWSSQPFLKILRYAGKKMPRGSLSAHYILFIL